MLAFGGLEPVEVIGDFDEALFDANVGFFRTGILVPDSVVPSTMHTGLLRRVRSGHSSGFMTALLSVGDADGFSAAGFEPVGWREAGGFAGFHVG